MRITAAISKGRMYLLNSVSPIHWMLDLPRAAAGSLAGSVTSKRLLPIRITISAAITTTTAPVSGR